MASHEPHAPAGEDIAAPSVKCPTCRRADLGLAMICRRVSADTAVGKGQLFMLKFMVVLYPKSGTSEAEFHDFLRMCMAR